MVPRLLFILLFWLSAHSVQAEPRIAVEGLLPNSAVITVDGQRKMLRVGQSFLGVRLVAADANAATLEFEGRLVELGLSQHIGSAFESPTEAVVTIARDRSMSYQTTALINGRSVLVLVDTGATTVAMSRAQANSLGVDYRLGQVTQVATASGVAEASLVTLSSVNVGGIEVDNVPAVVLAGSHPLMVLLGMTYLRHVSMSEEDGILTLTRVQ